jgi:hypothetical protein
MCGYVYVWVGFIMCGCSDNCMDVLVICILVFTVFFVLFHLCVFILICY